jgi:polysaccharide export outer membrane protein
MTSPLEGTQIMKRSTAIVLSFALLTAGCGHAAPFIWIQDVPPSQLQESAAEYTIKDGDLLTLKIFANGQPQEAVSGQQKLRPDGRIVIPLAGEFLARGKQPKALGKEIELALKAQFQGPSVAILVDAPQPWGAPQPNTISVSVVGEVKNNGVYNVEPGANVLQVLAAAGGLSDYAGSDQVYVLRKTFQERIRFRMSDLRGGEKRSVTFALAAGDVIVVE